MPDDPTAGPSPATPPTGPAFSLEEPYEDPTPGEVADATTTPLDDVVAALTAAPVEEGGGLVRIAVPGRPGIVALFRDDITGRQIEEWRKQAKVRGNVDVVKFGGIILAHTSAGLERDGETVVDPETREPATLRSRWLQGLYGAPGAVETARRLFGKDGYLNAAATDVLAAAGWGSELGEDPT